MWFLRRTRSSSNWNCFSAQREARAVDDGLQRIAVDHQIGDGEPAAPSSATAAAAAPRRAPAIRALRRASPDSRRRRSPARSRGPRPSGARSASRIGASIERRRISRTRSRPSPIRQAEIDDHQRVVGGACGVSASSASRDHVDRVAERRAARARARPAMSRVVLDDEDARLRAVSWAPRRHRGPPARRPLRSSPSPAPSAASDHRHTPPECRRCAGIV